MNRTSPIVVLVNQDALEIKADGTFTVQAGGIQSFADVADLGDAVAHVNPYATYEPDFWLLDGNYKFALASASVGYMSTGMSAANTDFGTDPEIRVQFTTNHSTTGLKLYFSEYTSDWADEITITFRNSGGSVIRSDTYTPTAATFETNQAVSNFRRIDIFFNSTNKAQRYARLTGIDFDELTIFQGTDIKEARLVEQIDPLAIELPINTLELTLFNADGDFSIVDPAGFYANLQYKEPLDIFENINNEVVYIGRFYLDKWESKSETIADFHAMDAIGILEGLTFMGGCWSANASPSWVIPIDDLLTRIFADADIEYELDASFSAVTMNGCLPITTCREALQQILIAIGAYATCARSSVVQIKPIELASDLVTYDHTILSAQKGQNSPVDLRTLVTGVEVLGHVYSIQTLPDAAPTVEIYSQFLAAGNHTIIFDQPYTLYALVFTGATLAEPDDAVDMATNYVVINVASPGTVTIEAEHTIIDRPRLASVYNGSLPAGTQPNVLRIDNANFVFSYRVNGGAEIAPTVAQRIYDYYEQRHVQETRLFASPVAVGDSILIDTQSGRQIAGIVEKMTTNLAGGFVSDLEIVGVVVPV